YHHQVVERLGRQHGIPVGLRLAVEQFLADRRDDLHVYARLLQFRQLVHQVDRGTRALRDYIPVARAGCEIADRVEALGRRLEVGIGELAAVGYQEIGTRHFQRNDAHFGIARGDFGGGEVPRGDVVVIPEIQVDRLPAWKQLPRLRREDAEVRAGIGRRLRPRMSRQNVQ